MIKTWRQRLDILRGTAISETEGESLSADIHLVAYGVAKNVTGIQLSQWLAGKGLRVLSCDLLTKYERARSLSYKITVKSCDYDKAHNPEIWPARVGVRLFKFFNASSEMKGIDRYNNRSPQTTSSRIGTNNRILTDTRPRVLQSNRHVQQQNTSRYEVQTPHVNLHAFQNNSETQQAIPSEENPFLLQNNRQTRDANLANENMLRFQNNYRFPNVNPPRVRFREDLTESHYV